MCGQLALAEEALTPLGEEIVTRLRAGPYLQFDDTSVLVQAEDDKARFGLGLILGLCGDHNRLWENGLPWRVELGVTPSK